MARRAKAPKSSAAPKSRKAKKGDNIDTAAKSGDLAALDAQYDAQLVEVRKHYLEHRKKVAEQREAAGRYRASIKVACTLGAHRDMHASDITRIMADEDRDPAEIDREIARYNYNAQARKIPIGGQLGLILGGKSIATEIEDKDRKNGDVPPELGEIEREGFLAHQKSIPLEKCPHAAGSPERARWADGWGRSHDAVAAAASKWAEGIGKPANGGAAHH